jgi:hypothetical protein
MAIQITQHSKNITALLSATGIGQAPVRGACAIVQMANQPLISHQIEQLAALGIKRFLIEMETISGALLQLSDSFSERGLVIDFVRSPQELGSKIGSEDMMLVLIDGIMCDNALLAEMVNQPSPFILTLDSRPENNMYERIDLNHFWAGVALLGPKSVAAIAALPEGYDIGSSLLRQALQDDVVHGPLNQEALSSGKYRRITSQAEADAYTRGLFVNRGKAVQGAAERSVFGAIAARLAPNISRNNASVLMLEILAPLLAVTGIALAYNAYHLLSFAAGLLTIFVIIQNDIVDNVESATGRYSIRSLIIYALLSVAFVMNLWSASIFAATNIFIALVCLALLIHAFISKQSGWYSDYFGSPAIIAFAGMIFAAASSLIPGFMLVAIMHLATILFLDFNSAEK